LISARFAALPRCDVVLPPFVIFLVAFGFAAERMTKIAAA
jgi:hypothetical protein